MSKAGNRTGLQAAAARLRALVLDAEDGALIGSEEALVARLGCSRGTARQVARLLEREGLLRVRRGINGGYFGCRPDAGTIEASVSAYLETLDMDAEDVTVLASTLWVEVMRKAAAANRADALLLAAEFRPKVMSVKPGSTFTQVRQLEQACRKAIFKLTRSGYIELIFEINSAFASRKFAQASEDIAEPDHREFVRAWKESKMLELSAIQQGDVELAIMAARYSRTIWHRRVWAHADNSAEPLAESGPKNPT
jgi:GntR family transcriptional repressor for pyruvate dehydrogenase complex